MGVETWLYRRLGRPGLRMTGEVLGDPITDPRNVDWIGVELSGAIQVSPEASKPLRYLLARGACDMRAIAHYCHALADSMVEEFVHVRGRQHVARASLMLAVQAIAGFPEAALADFAPMGLLKEDVTTALATGLPQGPGAWLMGFSTELQAPLFRHKATGALLPNAPAGLAGPPQAMMRGGAPWRRGPGARGPYAREIRVLRAPAGTDAARCAPHRVFPCCRGNPRFRHPLQHRRPQSDGSIHPMPHFGRHNDLIREVAAEHSNVELILPRDFMTDAEHAALIADPHHFDRMVYFRIFQHIASGFG